VIAAREDPSSTLEALMQRFAGTVRGLAATRGLDLTDVDEVLQEVRIRLWRTLEGRGNDDPIPASYLYRTAMSATVDVLRRRRARRAEPLERADAEPDARPATRTAMDDAAYAELVRAVAEEVHALPADRQVALRMHLEGYEREEIARLLGWSEPRTRHLIYRALATLRARLRARGLGPDEDR
jgi:RNA polymerase sigma factor (sigma-70 family)